VAENFVLYISDDYPESYWLKAKVLTGEDPGIFKEGVVVSDAVRVVFECSKKISIKKLLDYDFFYSDGPNLVSPRLHELMKREKISGVQFIDAELVLKGTVHAGYKIFNVIDASPAFDLSKSISEPLLSYLPNGPQWYSKIVLSDKLNLSSDIVRAEEDNTTIVVNARVKSLFENNAVRGLECKA